MLLVHHYFCMIDVRRWGVSGLLAVVLGVAGLGAGCSAGGDRPAGPGGGAVSGGPATPGAGQRSVPAPVTPGPVPHGVPGGRAAPGGAGVPGGSGDSADPGSPGGSGVAGRAGYPAARSWRHRPGLTWQWQLTGKLNLSVDADVFELDGFTTPAAAVARLHAAGRRVICYISVGSYENFRPDAHRFPRALLGARNGWPGERWLDIRQWARLEPLLRARMRMCKAKGFDAVEADNVDGYANDPGFALTAGDQLRYNRRVAQLAHSLGLAIGLKNDLDQVAALEPYFDFAVNEECFRYRECGKLKPFTRAGKPVFHAEYDVPAKRFCAQARALRFAAMHKRMDLDAWRVHC